VIVVGLTGSIAMGKSTVGAMLQAAGAPRFDSDAAVHEFYRSAEAQTIEEAFPGVLVDGVVDRTRLSALVLADSRALARLEAIVHPRVAAARKAFLVEVARQSRRVAIVDIPLLFESGSDKTVDLVLVVSAPESVQKARALTRKGMTPERFAAIIAQQIPDRDKRRRAHFVIATDGPFEATRAQAEGFLQAISAMMSAR
jgi:dephospho-CoA kinase